MMSTQVLTAPTNAPNPQDENEAPTAISLAQVAPFNAARVPRPMQSVLLLVSVLNSHVTNELTGQYAVHLLS